MKILTTGKFQTHFNYLSQPDKQKLINYLSSTDFNINKLELISTQQGVNIYLFRYDSFKLFFTIEQKASETYLVAIDIVQDIQKAETSLFDQTGRPIAYIANKDGTIYTWNGKPVAYLDGENIYGFNGRHLGWYEEGVIYDHQGYRVGFHKDKSPVFTTFEPFKSFKQFKPFKAFKQFAPFKPYKKHMNSTTSLLEFLEDGR